MTVQLGFYYILNMKYTFTVEYNRVMTIAWVIVWG